MSKPRVLFVDDDDNLLQAMRRTFAGTLELVIARGGEEAMRILAEQEPFALIVSDLRMPTVDGVTLLRHARERYPDMVRILLSGQADLEDAIAAVNEGRVFRFLTKPCAASALRQGVLAGLQQHELQTAESVVLQQTLRGSIRALVELVSLVHPSVGAQTSRVRRLVLALAERAHVADPWRVEVAALLAYAGYVTLAPATVAKLERGQPLLTHEERERLAAPEIAARLIANLPHMDEVQAILLHQNRRFDGADSSAPGVAGLALPLGARLLKLANDYDRLETQGLTPSRALAALGLQAGAYDPGLLVLLRALKADGPVEDSEAMSAGDLELGMVLLADVRDASGELLIARGMEVNGALCDRIARAWNDDARALPVQVLRGGPGSTSAAA